MGVVSTSPGVHGPHASWGLPLAAIVPGWYTHYLNTLELLREHYETNHMLMWPELVVDEAFEHSQFLGLAENF